MDSNRKLVVLTPVKNESWFLPIFCKSTSIWADYIIIADQNSTDGSKEIASQFPKVVIIDNKSSDLDEDYRNRILLEKARELVGYNGILFRIDADEIFTPNFNSTDWIKIRQSKPGTFWRFRWIQINKDLSSYWETKGVTTYGAFVDDGREYDTHGLIHCRDMFAPSSLDSRCVAQEIGLLHFQFVDWKRMQSKHRWYQCYERINFPKKSAIDIFRIYHWMYNPSLNFNSFPVKWTEDYHEKYGIKLNSYIKEDHYWWDDKVRDYFLEYSPAYFNHTETCRIKELPFAKGKNVLGKSLLLYLNITKQIYNTRSGLMYILVLKIDSFLRNKLGL